MQQTTDSTIPYTQEEDSEDRQNMIAYYVDQLLRRIVERPYDSVPQLFQHVTRGGPCLCPADVIRLFGGRVIFRHTCRRMNMIRRAVLNDTIDTVPVELRTGTEQERSEMVPPFTDYRYFWCPNLGSPVLFWYVAEGMEQEINRYPAVLYTDEFFQETESEDSRTDVSLDYSTDGDEWFGALGPIDEMRFWEATDSHSPVRTDAESSDEETSDEEWRRPPPINTSGPEWYYE